VQFLELMLAIFSVNDRFPPPFIWRCKGTKFWCVFQIIFEKKHKKSTSEKSSPLDSVFQISVFYLRGIPKTLMKVIIYII